MNNTVFIIAISTLVLASCYDPTPPPASPFPSFSYPFPSFKWIKEPPIKIDIDGNAICVPRQFLDPKDELANETIKNTDGTTKSITPNGALDIEFTALLPQLNGYTEDYLKYQIKDEKTKLHYKSALVKISLLNNDSVKMYNYSDKFKGFEKETFVDKFGFSTRKRNKDCASEVYSASPTIALGADKNCAYEELKFANPAMPNLILRCWPAPGADRCYTDSYSTIKNTTYYMYSFDISQLPNFVSINQKVESRVESWIKDDSCKK